MFRAIAKAYGHVGHFWAKAVALVAALIFGWFWGDIMAVMVAYTLFLSVTTDFGSIIIQNTGSHDTEKLLAQGKELGRAVPGARDVIDNQG